MKVSKLFLALATVVAVLLATASPADAVFRIRVEDVGAGVGAVVTDNGVGDLQPMTDVILFSGTVGAFTISIQIGTATPGVPFAGFFDAIDLNSVSVTTVGGGTLRIVLEKDGFNTAPNGGLALESRIGGVNSGPGGSTVTYQSWANAANLIPTLGPDQGPGPIAAIPNLPPAGSTNVFTAPGISFGPGAFSGSRSVTFTKSGLYSIFSSATIAMTGPGNVTFDHTTGTTPAPAGLILLAAGVPCFVMGYFRRKKAVVAA